MNLAYRSFVPVEALKPNECTIHRAADSEGRRWWLLWANVYRDDKVGELIDIAVPVNPGGGYIEAGPGGKTWGLNDVGGGIWAISPSINVIDVAGSHRAHPGPHQTAQSIWHQTPCLVGMPTPYQWGAP